MALHLLTFGLLNPATLTLDKDGPVPFLSRLITVKPLNPKDVDLSQFEGKSVLITGATSGCGLECAKILARLGCNIIITARDLIQGQDTVNQLHEEASSCGAITEVDLLSLDLSSFESIRNFASQIGRYTHLDVAILNAGLYQPKFSVCAETGLEQTVQVSCNGSKYYSLLEKKPLSSSINQSIDNNIG